MSCCVNSKETNRRLYKSFFYFWVLLREFAFGHLDVRSFGHHYLRYWFVCSLRKVTITCDVAQPFRFSIVQGPCLLMNFTICLYFFLLNLFLFANQEHKHYLLLVLFLFIGISDKAISELQVPTAISAGYVLLLITAARKHMALD